MSLGNRTFFYERQTISVTAFPSDAQFKFPFLATRVLIAVRNLKAQEFITFSYNGTDTDGELFPDDAPIAFDGVGQGKLWFKSNQNQAAEIRVWAWRGGNG